MWTSCVYLRSAISKYVPYLGVLLCITGRDRFSSSSFQSTRRSTLTSQSEGKGPNKPRHSSLSESESVSLSHIRYGMSLSHTVYYKCLESYESMILVSCLCDSARPTSPTRRRTARLGRLSVVSCPVMSNRCATAARGQRWEVTPQESLRELPPTTPPTRPYVSSHRSQWVMWPGLCQHTVT